MLRDRSLTLPIMSIFLAIPVSLAVPWSTAATIPLVAVTTTVLTLRRGVAVAGATTTRRKAAARREAAATGGAARIITLRTAKSTFCSSGPLKSISYCQSVQPKMVLHEPASHYPDQYVHCASYDMRYQHHGCFYTQRKQSYIESQPRLLLIS
jgi:hypothetical protein